MFLVISLFVESILSGRLIFTARYPLSKTIRALFPQSSPSAFWPRRRFDLDRDEAPVFLVRVDVKSSPAQRLTFLLLSGVPLELNRGDVYPFLTDPALMAQSLTPSSRRRPSLLC